MSLKNLYILRHAKTETGSASQDDHTRKLVERGVEAAQIMGAYIFKQGIKPQKVLCSDATRTRQTWEQISAIYPTPINVEYSRKLYMASANEILNNLMNLPELVSSVMIVGHNPGMHQLSLKLAKNGDHKLLDQLYLKFPTCAMASIAIRDTSWGELMNASGMLLDYVTPKMLAGIGDD